MQSDLPEQMEVFLFPSRHAFVDKITSPANREKKNAICYTADFLLKILDVYVSERNLIIKLFLGQIMDFNLFWCLIFVFVLEVITECLF